VDVAFAILVVTPQDGRQRIFSKQIMADKFLIAEYCPGPFYMGWWLYLRDTNDGKQNDMDGWGWLRGEFQMQAAWDFVCSIGYAPPALKYHGQNFSEWYAATLPKGLKIAVDRGEPWVLLEKVAQLPKQCRRSIRTIRRAEAIDKREDAKRLARGEFP
jgi:hypothetical protein